MIKEGNCKLKGEGQERNENQGNREEMLCINRSRKRKG